MTSRTYIMIVVLTGVGITIYLSLFMPTMVPIVVPPLISAGLLAIPMLAKMGETEAKVDKAIVKVDSAIVASKDNAAAIESVSTQVSENTVVTETVKAQAESTHDLVNGHLREWQAALEKIAALEATIAEQAGNAAGRETGRQIAIELLAANAQAPDVQPDGTVVVTAPALIAVKVPEPEGS